jgi:hypothetical protein
MCEGPVLAKGLRRPLADRRDGHLGDFLDLVEAAHIIFQGDSDGDIAFGALNGDFDVRSGSRDGAASAEFSWGGL